MTDFTYTITDNLGIHARPAGMLVKEASKYQCDIQIEKGEKKADAKRIFSVMSLGIKHNESIKIILDGPDEKTAKEAMQNFFTNNL